MTCSFSVCLSHSGVLQPLYTLLACGKLVGGIRWMGGRLAYPAVVVAVPVLPSISHLLLTLLWLAENVPA